MHDLVRISQMFSVVRWLQFLHTAITTHKPLVITNFYLYQSPAKCILVWVGVFLLELNIVTGTAFWKFSMTLTDEIMHAQFHDWKSLDFYKLGSARQYCHIWVQHGALSTAYQAIISNILETISTSGTRAVINCRLKYVLETIST
jgi:hypothetical protein